MSRIEKALEKASQMRNQVARQQEPTQLLRQHEPTQQRREALSTAKATPVDNPYLVVYTDPSSPAAEEYKKLKSAVIRLTKDAPQRNLILVTSAVGGEGKSMTSANLALSMSQEYDHSVMLIDADLRRPSLHRLFQVPTGGGLSDCVAEGRDIGPLLVKVGNGNLSFLPAGKKTENPVELLSSHRMQQALLDMKYRYADRYIIIDTPPALLFAETKALTAVADGIIFVIKEGLAPLKYVSDALGMLEREKVLGIVYNAIESDERIGHAHYHAYYRDYRR